MTFLIPGKFLVPGFVLFLLMAGVLPAETLHVPGDRLTIQAGIDAADNGDTVLVAPNVYAENIDFKGKAIVVKSETGPHAAMIFGQFPSNPDYGSVVTFKSGEGPGSVLEGFTLVGGKGCNGLLWGIEGMCGGGVLCTDGSSPTIRNCIFQDNYATARGGAMFIRYSSPVLEDCIFISNAIKGGSSLDWGWGGAIFIEGDSSLKRGSPLLVRCCFIDNWTDSYYGSCGGAIYNRYASTTLIDCKFMENRRYYGQSGIPLGGGGALYNESGHMQVTRCLFENNSSETKDGGALFAYGGSMVLSNCVFNGNRATDGAAVDRKGGAINNVLGDVTLSNCTLINNIAGLGGAFSVNNGNMTLSNCIVWRNLADEIHMEGYSHCDITYSCVRNGHAGMGNIDVYPAFVDLDCGDYHLTYASPCRDAGDGASVLDAIDVEGDPRIAQAQVDMGADEFYRHLYCTGQFTAGGAIKGKFIDLPGTEPVGLFISSELLDPPMQHPWGEFHLAAPWFLVPLVPIPGDGVLVVPTVLPQSPAVSYEIFLQALIGDKLTNLFTLEVN